MRKRLQGIELQSDMTYLTSYKDGGCSFKNRMSLRIGHGSSETMGQGGGRDAGPVGETTSHWPQNTQAPRDTAS